MACGHVGSFIRALQATLRTIRDLMMSTSAHAEAYKKIQKTLDLVEEEASSLEHLRNDAEPTMPCKLALRSAHGVAGPRKRSAKHAKANLKSFQINCGV